LEVVGETFSLHIFHGVKKLTFHFSAMIDSRHIRVVYFGCRASFAKESLVGRRVFYNIFADYFKRRKAIQKRIFSQVSNPHGSTPQFVGSAIWLGANGVVLEGKMGHEEQCEG
jgi:acetyltransferase-like isoleucine patch superfamily enzyme